MWRTMKILFSQNYDFWKSGGTLHYIISIQKSVIISKYKNVHLIQIVVTLNDNYKAACVNIGSQYSKEYFSEILWKITICFKKC
jgi:hypothetical protein